MVVFGIEVRDRPKHGTRAFSDAEEAQIYQVLKNKEATEEEIAAAHKVRINTIKNANTRAARAMEAA